MDKQLKIILELVADKFEAGIGKAKSAFNSFAGVVKAGAAIAVTAITSIVAIVTVLVGGIVGLIAILNGFGNKLADTEAKFKLLTGSADDAAKITELLRTKSMEAGVPVEELGDSYQALALAAKEADGSFNIQKFEQMVNVTERLTAATGENRDVVADAVAKYMQSGDTRMLSAILKTTKADLKDILGITDDLGESSEEFEAGIFRFEKGQAKSAEGTIDKLNQLTDALGITDEKLKEFYRDTESGGRLKAVVADFLGEMGKPINEAIDDVLNDLADLYAKDPEAFRDLAHTIGESIAMIIRSLGQMVKDIDPQVLKAWAEGLSKAIASGDWQKAAESFGAIGSALWDIANALHDIIGAGGEVKGFIERATSLPTAANAPLGGGTPGPVNRQFGPGGWAAGGSPVRIEIELKSDMLDARITQGADQAVVKGFNQAAEEFHQGGH